MKDNFSIQANQYAKFRPGYPELLFSFLFEHCQNFDNAWDCATGNGQIALQLASKFRQVEATDISENQLKNAPSHPNIRYSLQPAEAPVFSDSAFDLIVVGQAAHWFDFDRFYPQMQRVLKPDGLLALIGYQLVQTDEPAINALIDHLYEDLLGPTYWDAERLLVDNRYTTIPFPFTEIPFPPMEITYQWTRDQLLGFFSTWSGLQHYNRRNGRSPVDGAFLEKLSGVWPDGEIKRVKFPIFGRAGIPPFNT